MKQGVAEIIKLCDHAAGSVSLLAGIHHQGRWLPSQTEQTRFIWAGQWATLCKGDKDKNVGRPQDAKKDQATTTGNVRQIELAEPVEGSIANAEACL